MKKLVLINGVKRSGKDYVASLIKEKLKDVDIISFAGPIKEIIAETFDISLETLDDFKNNPEESGIELKIYPNNQEPITMEYISFRKILQRFGTEAMKPIFGDNVWADLGIKNAISSDNDIVIIPDFRFIIEYETAVEKMRTEGFELYTINIFNNNLPDADNHSSETELKDNNFEFNYTIDNTGRPDISMVLDKILNKII